MTSPKAAVIAVIAVLSALAIAFMLWPSPSGANSQLVLNASVLDKVDIERAKGEVRRRWTSENFSRVFEEEYYIDVAPVRNFTVRPGYYRYVTSLSPLSDGYMYSRYEFNVTQKPWGYEIIQISRTYIIEGKDVIESIPAINVWRIVNNTLYEVYAIDGEDMYIFNYTVRPGSCGVFSSILPVAPSIWPYVKEGRVIRTKYVANGTDLWRGVNTRNIVTSIFRVDKDLVDCQGPSGRCYVVEMVSDIKSNIRRGGENLEGRHRYRYVYYIDLSGVVVKAEKYDPTQPGSPLMSEIKLVEWR